MKSKRVAAICAAVISVGTLPLLSIAVGVPASAAFAADETKAKSPDDPRARRICRYLTPSGSRLTRRVCRTQADWARNQDQSADGLSDYQTKNATTYQQQGGPM